MKKVIICIFITCSLNGQEYFNKEYTMNTVRHVVVENFNGNIDVMATESDIVRIVARLQGEVSENTLKLKEHVVDDLVYLYIEHPCNKEVGEFEPEHPFLGSRFNDDCEWDGEERQFPNLDYTLEIPKGVNVYVSTVMDGNIKVDGVSGDIHALNVNGSVELRNVNKVHRGTTVNGNIDIYYNEKPTVDGKFSTINGEINLYVPNDASLSTKFKSYAGELYTDLESATMQDKTLVSGKMKAGQTVKIHEFSEAKIGSGEVTMVIETFNGNAYINKIK